MTDETSKVNNNVETVDGNSISKANNPISRATLVMIGGTVIFIIIAGIIISMFFSAPTGAG